MCRTPGTAGTIARLGAAPSLRRGRVPTLYARRPRRPVGPVPIRALRPAPRPELWGGDVGRGAGAESAASKEETDRPARQGMTERGRALEPTWGGEGWGEGSTRI